MPGPLWEKKHSSGHRAAIGLASRRFALWRVLKIVFASNEIG